MDQNPENQNIPGEPLFTDVPTGEPIPDPSPAVLPMEEPAVSAAQEVIDITPVAVETTAVAADEPAWATGGTAPEAARPAETPLKPEILNNPAQTSPKKNSNGWVIALVILLVVCCCCIAFLIPVLFLSNVFFSVLGGLYQTIIDVLNSIFNGTIQFY